MKLSGSWHPLLFSRRDDLKTVEVEIVDTTENAIDKWGWTTRSSPIFPFEGTDVPDLKGRANHLVFFVGPLDPGLVELDVPSFATLGTYNLIFIVRQSNARMTRAVQELLNAHPQTRWECWLVSKGLVVDVVFGGQKAGVERHVPPRRAKVAPGLTFAAEENSTLFAAAITKSNKYFPTVADELEHFSEAFRNQLENDTDGDSTKLSWLVNVNAALSRYTSQAFAGVSPIQATESHYWSHSLLGTGLACQALVNIRRFSERAIGRTDWIDLIDALATVSRAPEVKPFHKLNSQAAEDWTEIEDLVKQTVEKLYEAVSQRPESDDDKRLPLIVCFSGRDGFRSTLFSLSAPLEVISSANAYGWTPMTLSHEICHVWIKGILSAIFPPVSDAPAHAALDELITGARRPVTLLDEVRRSMFGCYHLLQREFLQVGDEEDEIPAALDQPWDQVVRQQGTQVNETLTHILDYQFFYEQDQEHYIRSIWSSWDEIPNIKDRLYDYLLRSACALLSEHLNHDDPLKTTLERLCELLKQLHGQMPTAQYVGRAIEILERDSSSIAEKLARRLTLVRLAKTFFTNRNIAARLSKEHEQTGGAYDSLTWLVLDDQQIWNPLKFVGHFSTDRKGDRSKSLWILTKIAFMQSPNETFA